MPCTEADRLPLLGVSLAREDTFREESEEQIAFFGISISILSLNARLGRECQLGKGIEDVILLITVYAKPITSMFTRMHTSPSSKM